MKNDPVEFLKTHSKKIRAAIQERLGEQNQKQAIAIHLFEKWREDLELNRVAEREGAFIAAEPLTLEELALKYRSSKDNVKPFVTRARKELHASPFVIAGNMLHLEITEHPYRFSVAVETDPLAIRKLVWEPYLNCKPIVVGCVKRIFFKVGKDVYARNVQVDQVESYDKCNTLKSLIGTSPARPVRMYAPSGEISASYALLDMFNNELQVRATGALISPSDRHLNEDLVILGSGIEKPHYGPPSGLAFSFRNLRNGVEDARSHDKILDRYVDQRTRVPALVQRWQETDGRIITVIYSSHAFAVEVVVRHLVSERLPLDLRVKFSRLQDRLRNQIDFECIFNVEFDRNGLYFQETDFSIVRLGQKAKHRRHLSASA